MKKLVISYLLLLFTTTSLNAQPFIEEIKAFQKQDSIAAPEKNQVLFIGSSSLTNWKDVQNYFPEYKILNRGFGGSTLEDVYRYVAIIIYPYQPKQIVIYCGENDLAIDSTATAKKVFYWFKQLYKDIRYKYSKVPIAYISMKPIPSRWYLKNKMIVGNKLIEKFISNKKRNGKFINVWEAMLNENNLPNQSIFLEDNLHMNAKGYTIWQKLIQPHLIK